MRIVRTELWVLMAFLNIREHLCYLLNFSPDYKEALKLSLLFYEAQRSGKLPTTNRIKWRGDSALNDRGMDGEDLTGGYYDASDYVKFGFTMAFTTTMLSWGVLSYEDAYKEVDQYLETLDAIKWAIDYFIKCHVGPNELYGQVGDFSIDHAYWGRPEDMNMTRPAYKIDQNHPGTDLASQVSAAFSSASIIFKDINYAYSKELLKHAKELYVFAKTYKGSYQDVIPGAALYYESTSYGDELVWAATWLHKATGDMNFLTEAINHYKNYELSNEKTNTFSYDKKVIGIQILLASITESNEYLESVRNFCDHAIEKEQRTPKGLIYIDKFGTLSHAANIAFACLNAADLKGMPFEKYLQFAQEQIDYILGAKGRSFLVGYGQNYPKRPYHASSSCPDRPSPCGWDQYSSTLPNPQILYGALVSGPDENDYYEDTREEFLYNDVTIDYNAGFQSATAGLIHYLYPQIS